MSSTNGTRVFPPIDPKVITGPTFVGMMLNWGLLGVLLAQVLAYHRSYHNRDRALIKWLVYTTCALEVMFTITLTHYAYRLVITSRGDPAFLFELSWSAGMITPSSGTISCLVQSFFAWRAWMLTDGSIIFTVAALVIVVLALAQFAASVGFSIIFGAKYDFYFPEVKGAADLKIPKLIQLPGALVTDLMIVVVMLILLNRAKQRSKVIRRTESLLNRLITLTVGTGFVTAIAALVDVLLYTLPSMQTNNAHTVVALLLGKLYSTMLLANLNGRGHFGGSETMMSVHVHKTDDMELPTTGTARSRTLHQEIHVSTDVENDFGNDLKHANSQSDLSKRRELY